ncbi:carboxypeptidase regulatory-like domain-containing protein [Hymenobacter endophyticus]|uniref:Carboxypeptidase-like regulatory domain-containing protein n=1 Tax=Hymenobacter endophyticus TaxID=3076335 RepID=A0ABU3TLB6_9BACT|nr:carboxypeptidase regulatory-like domain-containing protein [Hymenobacter endophyticus]MDU0371985.1 carboxypeptidase-like regulatory domain-containing protein [Hymenobacter endophyticus]
MDARKLLLAVLCSLCSGSAWAQFSHGTDSVSVNAPRIVLTGTVTDEQANPIAGATVRLQGIVPQYCITNSRGRYLLQVPAKGATVTVSFSGYLSQDHPVDSRRQLDVVLQPAPGFHRPHKARVVHRRYLRTLRADADSI